MSSSEQNVKRESRERAGRSNERRGWAVPWPADGLPVNSRQPLRPFESHYVKFYWFPSVGMSILAKPAKLDLMELVSRGGQAVLRGTTGRTFLDRQLSLPQAGPMTGNGIPAERGFARKPALATTVIACTLDAGVPAP